jgi:ABC-type oligopeptide transport system substrate-binding subunit
LPAEIIEGQGDAWSEIDTVVTSGPFVLSRASVADQQTVLERNPFWPIAFQGNVDVVNLFHVGTETAFSLWQDKALDLAPVPAAALESVRAEVVPRYDLVASNEVFYLGYNFDSEVFRYPEVRRAFGAAIDRERLIEEAYAGRGQPMRHLTPEGVLGAPPRDEVGAGYSPDYARQQMNASPYRDCRLLPPIRYMVSALDVELQQAEIIRQMWVDELACLEDQITIEQVQFGKLLADTQANANQTRPDVWHLGWAAYYPDAENYFAILACDGSENRQRRPCSEVDQQIRAAEQSASLADRPELYREIERAFFAQGGIEPLTPLYTRARFIMRHVWLDYSPAAFGGEQYDTYRVSWEEKQLERTQ